MNNLNADPQLGKHQRHPFDRASIPGWGVDLSLSNRPGVPRERDPGNTGAHWHEPEQQQTDVEVFHSIERPMVTPVFGTTCPPKLLSGVLRRFAYGLGEDKKRRWMTLLLADRVDVVESAVVEFFAGRMDEEGKRTPNPINWLLFAGALTGIALGSAALMKSSRRSKALPGL